MSKILEHEGRLDAQRREQRRAKLDAAATAPLTAEPAEDRPSPSAPSRLPPIAQASPRLLALQRSQLYLASWWLSYSRTALGVGGIFLAGWLLLGMVQRHKLSSLRRAPAETPAAVRAPARAPQAPESRTPSEPEAATVSRPSSGEHIRVRLTAPRNEVADAQRVLQLMDSTLQRAAALTAGR